MSHLANLMTWIAESAFIMPLMCEFWDTMRKLTNAEKQVIRKITCNHAIASAQPYDAPFIIYAPIKYQF